MAAAEAIRSHIVDEREAQRGVPIFSEDLDEIIRMSNKVVVMFKGRIVGRFTRGEVDIDHIGLLMTGSASLDARGHPSSGASVDPPNGPGDALQVM